MKFYTTKVLICTSCRPMHSVDKLSLVRETTTIDDTLWVFGACIKWVKDKLIDDL